MTILAVDDTPASLRLLTDILKEEGFEVRSAISGELALHSAAIKPPDLVLLDIRMPQMDGYEVCRRLKADPALCNVPVIFVSAATETEEKVQGFGLGAVDFVTKPYQRDELMARVRTHLELYRLRHHLEGVLAERTAELRENSEHLRRSEAHFRAYSERSMMGMAASSPENGFIEVNDALCAMLGYSREELLGMNWAKLTHPDDLAANETLFNRVLSGEIGEYTMDKRFIAKGGSLVDVHLAARAVRRDDGSLDYMVALVEDITERMRSDMEIRRLEQEYRSLVENLPDIVSRFDRKLRRIYVNPALTHLTGIPKSSVLDKAVQDQNLPTSMANANADALRRVLSSGVSEVVETRISGIDGVIRYYQTRLVPEFGGSGEVETILTISRDISTLKHVETVLRESEERLHAIASNVPGMVLRCYRRAGCDRLGFTYVSDGAKDLLDIEPEAILQDENEFIDRICKEHAGTFHESMMHSQSGLSLWNWEGKIAAADGCVKWINLRATPHYCDEDICIWDGVAVNVTESKLNENKLIHTQNMLRELAAHLESVREEERRHVAREIHDELGQTLTALKMETSLARLEFGAVNPQIMKRLQSMSQLVERTVEISRHITSSLRPGALDLGIVAALEWLAEEFTAYAGIPCELTLDDGEITINETLSTAVFRIVQESLTNIARHAKATQVRIVVTRSADHFCFEVRDNGKGFDLHLNAGRNSFGLVGIRERAAILGGEFTLNSVQGQGTCVRVCFPVLS